MTAQPESPRATEIEAVVRGVPGVITVFPAGTTVSRLVDAGARLLGGRDAEASPIRLELAPEGARVDVAIGVDVPGGAVGISREAYAAVEALLAQRGLAAAEIRITVVHVGDSAREEGNPR